MMQGGDKVWWSDESQGGSGIRESYLDPTSTNNAQTAEPMPMLRPNVGTIYSGDAGQYSTLKLMASVSCEQG